MTSSKINCSDDLSLRIAQLRIDKLKQEAELKIKFSEFAETLNPVLILKKSVHEMVVDKEVKDDLLKVGLNLGTNFIIEKVLGRKSVKGYLSSVIVEKISTSLINRGILSEIITSFSKLVKTETKNETPPNTAK